MDQETVEQIDRIFYFLTLVMALVLAVVGIKAALDEEWVIVMFCFFLLFVLGGTKSDSK